MSAGVCCHGERGIAMNDLVRFVLALAAVDAGRQSRWTTARVAYTAVACVAAGGCTVAALACGIAALWIYTLPFAGTVGAPAIAAGVLLTPCLTLLALSRYGLKRRPVPSVDANVSLLLGEATRLVLDHKSSVLIAALLAGLIAGSNEK